MKGTDFIFFWHGFVLLLAGTALFLKKRGDQGSSFRSATSLFFILLGLSEWTAVFSTAFVPGPVLHLLRSFFFVSAFILLFEAARTAAINPRKWLAAYPVFAVITASAYFSGFDMLLASQYGGAIPSMILFAFTARKIYSKNDLPLTASGIIPFVIFVYAFFWLVPSPGCRYPAISGSQAVTAYLVYAAAIIRACCVSAFIVIIILRHFEYFFNAARLPSVYWLHSACAGILAAALGSSILLANITEKDMRSSIAGAIRAIAMGINPDRVKQLTFTADDKSIPEFTRIRMQMKAWGRYTGLRNIYSMKMKEGRLFFGPENIEEGDPMASPPGTEYLQPPRAFIDAWISGQSGVTKPYQDEYGFFVSGFAPVFDRISGRVLMLVALDYDVSLWYSEIQKGRARSYIPFMIITTCLLFWLAMFDRRREVRAERRAFFSRNMEVACCLSTGIILTCIISLYMNFFEKRQNAREFYSLADSWSNIIRSIITESRYHTEELSLYIENSEDVTWEEFRGFYSGKNMLPYVSIAWYPAVKAADRPAFESYMRRQKFTDYRIKGDTEGGVHGNAVYYPLAYVVPLEYGKGELGKDISGSPEIREALDTGLLTMMDRSKVELISSGGDMILLNPVYKKGKNTGFVRSVIDFKLLLSRVLSFRNSINLGIMVDISDIGDDGSERILLSYPPSEVEETDRNNKPVLFSVYPVFYSGHTLCMRLYFSEKFLESKISIAGPVTLALGIFLSAAVSLLAAYLIFRRNSLESEIEKRTRELRDNEDRYRIISEFTGQLVYGWDIESGMLNWSGRIQEITGFMPGTFNSLGLEGWTGLVHPDDRETVFAMLEEAKNTGSIFRCEYRMRRADGTYITVEDEGSFLHYGADNPVSMLGVIKDVTSRRHVEDELRESEERFRMLHNASFGGIAIHDRGIIKLCNMGLAEMTGYTVEELTGMNGLLLIAPDSRDSVMEKILSGYEKSYDAEGLRKDGSIFPIEINGRNIPYKGRNMRVTEFRNITERKKIEQQLEIQKKELEAGLEVQQGQVKQLEAINNELLEVNKRLAETEEKFSRAFKINPAIMVIVGMEDRAIADVNEMFLSVTGYARDDVIGKRSDELDFFADFSEQNSALDMVKKTRPLKNYELMIRTSSGETRFGLLSADVIQLKDKDYLLGVINDITDRKRLETAMRESEKKYRMLFDYSLDAIFIVEENIFIDCNNTAPKMFRCGREDLIGATPVDFSPPQQPGGLSSAKIADEKLNAVYEGKTQIFNWIHRAKDGTDFDAEVYMVRIEFDNRMYVMAIVRDIAERRRYEARLNHIQKMDAIGQLAGGIAHDFNNQLGGIMGYAELLSIKLQDENLKKYSDGIMSVASRASELTKKLLTFARKTELEAVPCDVHAVIKDTIEILEHSIDKRITLNFNPGATDFIISGDPADLQNSLLNLGLNARDAMDNVGVLTYSTYNIRLTPDDSATHLMSVHEGEYIAISIRDTGTGMSDRVKSHLFEPFFTTKSRGKGTGMGLASVYASVKNHHGSISVYSEEGMGTEFKIFLPLSSRRVIINTPDDEGLHIGGKRILIVDDEKVIRDILSEILRQEGNTVIEAADGNEAVKIYGQMSTEIDLVILDMVMPGLNGSDTLAGMKKINPEVNVIIASGFSPDADSAKMFVDGVKVYVRKPFQKRELMRALALVLKN